MRLKESSSFEWNSSKRLIFRVLNEWQTFTLNLTGVRFVFAVVIFIAKTPEELIDVEAEPNIEQVKQS